jgi:hypothetical protein
MRGGMDVTGTIAQPQQPVPVVRLVKTLDHDAGSRRGLDDAATERSGSSFTQLPALGPRA